MKKLIFFGFIVLITLTLSPIHNVCANEWGIPTITPTADTVDSTKIPAGGISAGDLITPLRLPHLIIEYGIFDSLVVQPTVPSANVLQRWKSSTGITLATIDTLSRFDSLLAPSVGGVVAYADSDNVKNYSLSGSDLMLEFRYLFKAYIDSVYSTVIQADTSFWTDGTTKYYKTAAHGTLVEGVY